MLAVLCGFLFGGRLNFVSMQCSPACSIGFPYTRYTHHGTRDSYTRYPEYETTTRRCHNTPQTTQQDHNILIESHLTTPLHVFSDLHFAYFTVTGSFPVGRGHGLRQVFCFLVLRLILGPNACADRSGRARSLHQIGLCIRRRRSTSALVNPLQLSFMVFLFSFSVWLTAGSPYRVFTRRLDGTVWTTTIKNTVIVMLYPPYTPLSLITTSLQATEDQTNVSPWPPPFLQLFFPFVHQSVDFGS